MSASMRVICEIPTLIGLITLFRYGDRKKSENIMFISVLMLLLMGVALLNDGLMQYYEDVTTHQNKSQSILEDLGRLRD